MPLQLLLRRRLRPFHTCSSLALAAWLLVGCGGSASEPDAAAPRIEDGGAVIADAGTVQTDASSPAHDSGAAASDAGAPASGGTIHGHVTRTAAPAAGGVGHLYIAVFDRDPVVDRASARAIARAIVMDADMREGSARIAYEVPGIPPRSEPYFVTAFLDDNGTVGTDPDTAGPDRGDLVALDGFASPRVTVASETRVPLDLVLSLNLPF